MARDMSLDEYFSSLRSNLVYAELSLMQLVKVASYLENRSNIEDDLRVNLEVQERALKDMLVLGVARLFDKKKSMQTRFLFQT